MKEKHLLAVAVMAAEIVDSVAAKNNCKAVAVAETCRAVASGYTLAGAGLGTDKNQREVAAEVVLGEGNTLVVGTGSEGTELDVEEA